MIELGGGGFGVAGSVGEGGEPHGAAVGAATGGHGLRQSTLGLRDAQLRFVSVLLDDLGSEDGVQPVLVLRLLLRHLLARQQREDAPVAQLLLPHFASLQLYLGNQPKGLGPPMRKPERMEPSREAAAEGVIPQLRHLRHLRSPLNQALLLTKLLFILSPMEDMTPRHSPSFPTGPSFFSENVTSLVRTATVLSRSPSNKKLTQY